MGRQYHFEMWMGPVSSKGNASPHHYEGVSGSKQLSPRRAGPVGLTVERQRGRGYLRDALDLNDSAMHGRALAEDGHSRLLPSLSPTAQQYLGSWRLLCTATFR